MPMTYADYLKEGARALSTADFGFSVKEGKWDPTYWEDTGRRFKGAKVLKLKTGKSASRAVQEIFDNPGLWSFDCSQFAQVVNFYAQMKTQNSIAPGAFDRQIAANGNRLEIKPFHGAHFTVRKHYYRCESRTEWMKYRTSSAMRYVETRIKAWDLVRAAPVGTRVNFALIGGRGAWRFENTVKVTMSPLRFSAHGLSSRKIWNIKDLFIGLARIIDGSVSTLVEAERIVWIKEVSIFADLPLSPHRVS